MPGLRGGTCQALIIQEKTSFILCPKTLTSHRIFLESVSWRSLGCRVQLKPTWESCRSVQGKLLSSLNKPKEGVGEEYSEEHPLVFIQVIACN